MQDTGIIRNYIEVPRGKLYHSYSLEDGRVRGSIVRTPSITNINTMEFACIGTHITDAQLAIVQCDPCFTCTDRAIQIVDEPLKPKGFNAQIEDLSALEKKKNKNSIV